MSIGNVFIALMILLAFALNIYAGALITTVLVNRGMPTWIGFIMLAATLLMLYLLAILVNFSALWHSLSV